jgi:FtsH-binding integral membrane protein
MFMNEEFDQDKIKKNTIKTVNSLLRFKKRMIAGIVGLAACLVLVIIVFLLILITQGLIVHVLIVPLILFAVLILFDVQSIYRVNDAIKQGMGVLEKIRANERVDEHIKQMKKDKSVIVFIMSPEIEGYLISYRNIFGR